MLQRVLLFLIYFCSFLANAGDTVLKLYRPYGEVRDQAPLTIKTKLVGQCTVPSRLITREDAWRCQAEGKVYDPCFVKLGVKNTEVICPQSPWVGDSVHISVNTPLVNQQQQSLDMSTTFPWAVELMNGERCQAVDEGTTFDQMPIRYRCSQNNVLIGYLQRCRAEWSMLEKTADGVKTVSFSRAWF